MPRSKKKRMKGFEVGERVLIFSFGEKTLAEITRFDHEGAYLEYLEDGYEFYVYLEGKHITAKEYLIKEEIYNSPLYRALE